MYAFPLIVICASPSPPCVARILLQRARSATAAVGPKLRAWAPMDARGGQMCVLAIFRLAASAWAVVACRRHAVNTPPAVHRTLRRHRGSVRLKKMLIAPRTLRVV